MNDTASEVLTFMKENDVQFVRLGFCDLFGMQKNISILPDQLPAAFGDGVSFDAHAIRGFRDTEKSDLFLCPDPATLTVLPWRPGPGRVVRFYCDIKNPDGSTFSGDSRQVLRQAVRRCGELGYVCSVGAECEFYLFKTDENGEPTHTPFDRGGYLDIAPLDRGENVRREICLCLEEMGIAPEASHHEQGPGQNEIDFRFGDPLSCADHLLSFQSVVKAIAARGGLFASFMPKPIPDAPGSGMHVNLSLHQNGRNLFGGLTDPGGGAARSFLAGILSRVPEITLFLNPIANSYDRLGSFEAPRYVSWSHQNRSQLVRIPAAFGEKVRMELRSPDPSLNPYLAFALILSAGLDGVRRGLELPPATDVDLYTAPQAVTKALTPLPGSLDQAVRLAKNSAFVRDVVGPELLDRYLREKEAEAAAFQAAQNKDAFYGERYFGRI